MNQTGERMSKWLGWQRVGLAAGFVAGLMAVGGCEGGGNRAGMRTADQRQAEQQEREAQARRADAERARALADIDALRSQLASDQARMQSLEKRLADAESQLAAQKDINLREMASNVSTMSQDLKQLKGEYVGLDYRITQRFQDVALIHANLEQADEDLRKHVAMTVTNLERRTAKEHADQSAEFTQKLEDERAAMMSTVRELERQTSSDRERAALAMKAVRDALASERTAVQLHAEKLAGAVSALDEQFGAEGDAARARSAAEAFAEARRLHQEYLDQSHRPELLTGAIEAYRRGLEVQPGAIDMHYELARLLRVARRADDAKPHLEYYLEHGSDPERVAQARTWLGE